MEYSYHEWIASPFIVKLEERAWDFTSFRIITCVPCTVNDLQLPLCNNLRHPHIFSGRTSDFLDLSVLCRSDLLSSKYICSLLKNVWNGTGQEIKQFLRLQIKCNKIKVWMMKTQRQNVQSRKENKQFAYLPLSTTFLFQNYWLCRGSAKFRVADLFSTLRQNESVSSCRQIANIFFKVVIQQLVSADCDINFIT